METMVHGKKQYFILLALSAVTAFLLPVICSAVTADLYIKFMPYSSWFPEPASFIIGIICGYISSAVLIFTAIRYRFKLCLPFAAISILGSVFSLIALFVVCRILRIGIGSIYYTVFNTLISVAVPFIYIGIAKLSAKYIKKEIAVVAVSLLGMQILSYIERLTSRTMDLAFNQLPITYSGRLTYLFHGLAGTLLYLLREYLFIAAAYLLIKLFFAENKKAKLSKITSKVTSTAKKLWGATSK